MHNRGDLAATYTALVSLLVLGDPFSRIRRDNLINQVRHCQQENGSFAPFQGSDEADMRFVYCACATSYMLNDWSGIQLDKMLQYIRASQAYDGGIAQGPGLESHGGSTFCAIASLYMLKRLDVVDVKRVVGWCCARQNAGFQGRINKDDDTCYSFWIGATLVLLDSVDLINKEENERFLSTTQTKFGGYSKAPGDYPDLLHSSLGLCSLSFSKVCAFLACPASAHDYLINTIHNKPF
jgi:geranylgeranyl transferase type-1 subunit beta